MTETLERDPIEARLRATLRAKAAQVVVPDQAFEIAVAPLVPDAPIRRRAVWLVGVLSVAAAVAGAFIVVGTHRHVPIVATESSAPVTTAPAQQPGPIAAPLLAPTWVPPGQQLWSLTAQPETAVRLFTGQVFGTVGGDGALSPGLMLDLQVTTPGSEIVSGTPITVRGLPGRTGPSKDAGIGTFAIEWVEGEADITANVRGASLDQAVAALDALRPRGADLMSGFDAASDPGAFPLLSEHLQGASISSVAATFEYAPTPAAGDPQYTVLASTAVDSPEFERVWIAGARNPDGSVWEDDPKAGYYVAWPDGREVVVRAHDPNVGGDVLARIAQSVSLLDESDAATLAAGAQARLGSMPSIGSVDLPSGRVDVRGTTGLETLCLTVPHGEPACADPYTDDAGGIATTGALTTHAGSAVIDGRWYVFAEATDGDPVISQKPGVAESDLPVETGVIGSTHIALVAVPDGIDHVNMLVPSGANGFLGAGFTRPAP